MYEPTIRYYRALDMAITAHNKQKRFGFGNYVCHPVEVANTLIYMGVEYEDLIIAALLHDVIEDASHLFNMNDILSKFGTNVCRLVASATDDIRLNRQQQKNAQVEAILHKKVDELILKLADRYCNVMGVVGKKSVSIEYTDHTEAILKNVVKRDDAPNEPLLEYVVELYGRINERVSQLKVGVV